MKAVSPSGMSDADLLDDLMGEVADSAADCTIAFLRDQPPTMSDENTDHVLDKHIMGEVVMSESTFPAAPLVRPYKLLVAAAVAVAAAAWSAMMRLAAKSSDVPRIGRIPLRRVPAVDAAPKSLLAAARRSALAVPAVAQFVAPSGFERRRTGDSPPPGAR